MGKRNSQLQELLVVAQNDYLTIVDTSAGQSKRVSVKTLVGNVDLGWVATGESWTYSSWTSGTRIGVITVPSDATTKYTPGMRTRFSQTTGGTKYGIIVAVTTTTLTVFFPSGTTFTNETITSPVYSSIKVPYGFNDAPENWTVQTTWNSEDLQSSPTTNTWYNPGSHSLLVPVGSWRLGYSVASFINSTASQTDAQIETSLSTSASSESDADFTRWARSGGATGTIRGGSSLVAEKPLTLGSATTYYFIQRAKTAAANIGQIGATSSYNGVHKIYATCSHL